jgi:hypothetical protein
MVSVGATAGSAADGGGDTHGGGTRERLPGMDPIWQAQNGQWGEIKSLDASFVRDVIDYTPPSGPAQHPEAEKEEE